MKKLILSLGICLILSACDTGTSNDNNTAENGTIDEQEQAQSNRDSDKKNNKSQEFVKEAASSGMLEVQLGQMASNKAQNQQVKEFAQMLVNEHKNANQKLKDLAQNLKTSVPQNLKDDHQDKVNDLQDVSGQEFDKEYMDMVIDLHEKDINKFEDAQGDVQNQELKSWIDQTLPKLKEHLQQAEEISNNVQQ